MLLGLTACTKTDPTTVDYNGYSYDDLQSACQNTFSTLISLTDEDKQSYLDSGTQVTIDLINSWDNTVEIAGDFVDFKDCSVTKSGKTLTVAQEAECTDRDIVMTYVYNYNSMEETGITVEPIYSMGETMSQAGMNTVMGIVIVFAMLILISLIIKCFEIIPHLQAKFSKTPAVEEKKANVPVVAAPVVEETDDLELVAVIAAAIAAATGTTTDDFVVRSIKRRR